MTPQQHRREVPAHAEATSEREWRRLSPRMIWVDLVQSVLSLVPVVIAVWVVGIKPGAGQLWPLIGLAGVGVIRALTDALRWVFTRYRVTASHVELKSGVLLRVHRSIQRDRIRSVDVEAKLRHRLSGLRVVKVGAGQQTADGESAVALDALTARDARLLQNDLNSIRTAEVPRHFPRDDEASPRPDRSETLAVLAHFEPRWVIYNVFNVWAYILALGLGWGSFWLLGSLGVNVTGVVAALLDWGSIGWVGSVAIGFVAVSIIGAAGLGVNYFTEYWGFELARVRSRGGGTLRTRQGLLTTREVNRDENRIRGAQISEPVVWRWMGASDTSVITTGLSMWSMSQPAAILPRGPVNVARRVAAQVLEAEPNPFEAALSKHPSAALSRRLWWATAFTAGVGLVFAWLVVSGVLPHSGIWAVAALWPCALGAAFVAYRALGHTIVGPYLVTRSGLLSRSTTVLQRSAVSTIVIRESLLQRRLGLQTVSTMTAAGYSCYDIPDLATHESLMFALQVAPDLLEPFLSARREGDLRTSIE